MPIFTPLGEFLRQLRMDLFMSYNQMVTEIGISHLYLSELETGRRKPSIELLEKIKTQYNLSDFQFEQMLFCVFQNKK